MDLLKIDIPEWGPIQAYLKPLTIADRLTLQDADRKRGPSSLLLVAMTLCDASGKLAFGIEGMARLGTKHWKVIDRIAKVAMRHNGLGSEAMESIERELREDQIKCKLLELEDRWGIPFEDFIHSKTSRDLTERIVFDKKIRVSEWDILAARIQHTMACLWRGDGPAPKFEDFLRNQESKDDGGEGIFWKMKAFFGK